MLQLQQSTDTILCVCEGYCVRVPVRCQDSCQKTFLSLPLLMNGPLNVQHFGLSGLKFPYLEKENIVKESL